MVDPEPPWPPWSPTPQCEHSWPPWNSLCRALVSSGGDRGNSCVSATFPFCAQPPPSNAPQSEVTSHLPIAGVTTPQHVLSFVKTMFSPPLIFRGHTCEGPRNTAVSAHPLWATTPHPADADLWHVCNNKNGEGACPLPGPLKILQFKGREDDC